jgi:hypothetical protein
LDKQLDVSADSGVDAVFDAIDAASLGQGTLTATYAH